VKKKKIERRRLGERENLALIFFFARDRWLFFFLAICEKLRSHSRPLRSRSRSVFGGRQRDSTRSMICHRERARRATSGQGPRGRKGMAFLSKKKSKGAASLLLLLPHLPQTPPLSPSFLSPNAAAAALAA